MLYNLKSALLILGTIIAVSSVAPFAKADEWNKETLITFSAAVDVPGKNLPAGTYIFKLAESNSDRDIVEIFTRDGRQLLATFIAVSKVRPTPANRPYVTFEEEPTGTFEAVKSWFYPGDTDGLEFVYRR